MARKVTPKQENNKRWFSIWKIIFGAITLFGISIPFGLINLGGININIEEIFGGSETKVIVANPADLKQYFPTNESDLVVKEISWEYILGDYKDPMGLPKIVVEVKRAPLFIEFRLGNEEQKIPWVPEGELRIPLGLRPLQGKDDIAASICYSRNESFSDKKCTTRYLKHPEINFEVNPTSLTYELSQNKTYERHSVMVTYKGDTPIVDWRVYCHPFWAYDNQKIYLTGCGSYFNAEPSQALEIELIAGIPQKSQKGWDFFTNVNYHGEIVILGQTLNENDQNGGITIPFVYFQGYYRVSIPFDLQIS